MPNASPTLVVLVWLTSRSIPGIDTAMSNALAPSQGSLPATGVTVLLALQVRVLLYGNEKRPGRASGPAAPSPLVAPMSSESRVLRRSSLLR
jgi:hypothetical protein